MESSESGGVRDQVQKAIDDLRAAGEKATGDVRSRIDDAVAQLRDVSGDASGKAQDQISGWRDTLDKATEDVRKELAKLAVRAQTSTRTRSMRSARSSTSAARRSSQRSSRSYFWSLRSIARSTPLRALLLALVVADLAELASG